MKQLFTLVLSICLVGGAFASSNNYYINDDAVETVLSSSAQVDFSSTNLDLENMLGTASIQQDKNVWVAVALDFFIGGLGVHRVYLGGKPALIAFYFFTCGGIFGIVPIVDLIVLVINSSDISAYINNDKFIMW